MAERITLTLDDDATVDGWLARPQATPKGALVVIQEIFGVNAHIRSVVDGYADDGYVALAPAFFDLLEPGLELAYDDAGMARGKALVQDLGPDRAVAVVASAAARLREDGLAVGAVGFCWGGTIAYLANVRLGLPAVSYYGARTVPYLDEPLRAPMIFHFGGRDQSISSEDIAAHRDRQPDAQVHVYPDAGHAFNRSADVRVYDAGSAALAHRRTLELFGKALA
jgi:carboxymethylenebutenolidase